MATRDQRALWYVARESAIGSPLQQALAPRSAEWYDVPVGPYDSDDWELALRRYKATRQVRMARRIQTLIAFGANPNQPNTAPLLTAVVSQNTEVARVLLAHGADPNYGACNNNDSRCESLGKTVLMWAAETGNPDMVRLLLDFKADRTLRDSTGRTVMHYAFGPDVWTVLEPGW
jgi:ankyrin repeat protein